jgi:2,3-dimethylmalate lyase
MPPEAARRRLSLRHSIDVERPLLVPGVTDAMGALLVQQTGFAAAYVTGAGLANAQFGLPDIGLVALPDLAGHVQRLAPATALPLLVDADTGFGGPLSVIRTVRALESAGAAAIQIEDQAMPKRCGHFDSHTLVSTGAMRAKIAAAVDAREDDNLLLVARTDARSVHGIDEALRRGDAYAAAGADAVFVEAPGTVEELERVGRELAGVPLVVNVVEGGKTPQLPVAEYADLGFTIVLHANLLMRAMHRAGRDVLAHLHRHGDSSGVADRIASWQERQSLFRLPELADAQSHYDALAETTDPGPHGATWGE